MMPVLEVVGWIGSGLVVLSMLQQRILRLRVINLGGCVLQIVYNGVLGVWPVLALNCVLAAVQIGSIYHLVRTRHSVDDYEVVPAAPDEPYLNHLIRTQGEDIARHVPGYAVADGARTSDVAFLVLRGSETVGYVLLRDAGDGVAEVQLDYVTERFRDFTPGEFVFRRSEVLQRRGFRKVVAGAGMREPYYANIGFDRVGDRYELVLDS